MEKVVALLCLVMFVVDVVAGQQHASNTVSCSDAVNALIPCGSFLLGTGAPAKPSKECCQSAEKLSKLAASAEIRRALCECLKKMAPSFGVKPERADKLPTLCNLKLSVNVIPDVNCARV